MRRLLAVLLLMFAVTIAAQERRPENYIRVLVPAGPVAGASGALWQTSLWLRNDSTSPVDVYPVNNRFCPVTIFGCFRGVREVPALQPKETAFSFGASNRVLSTIGDTSAQGSFFYVEKGRLADLSMQFFIMDVTKTPREVTELPLVAETDFHAGPRSILGVELVNSTRVSLRVFQLDPSMPDEFILRVFETSTDLPMSTTDGPPLLERRLRFTPGAPACDQNSFFQSGCAAGFIHRPGYVLIADLARELPQIATAVGRPFGIRIEIDGAPSLRYWAMATVTDNMTNHVTVHTVR